MPITSRLPPTNLQIRRISESARTPFVTRFQLLDCKTAPSFARSPKIGVFERVLTCGREMGRTGRGRSRAARGKKEMGRPRGLLPRPVLPFHDRASKLAQKTPIFGLLAKEGAVLQSIQLRNSKQRGFVEGPVFNLRINQPNTFQLKRFTKCKLFQKLQWVKVLKYDVLIYVYNLRKVKMNLVNFKKG